MEKWIPSCWEDLPLTPSRWLKIKFCLSLSFCFSTYSFVHVNKWPSENPQKHSYFYWSTFSTASAVHPPTNALNKAPSALKGLLLGEERGQSLPASSACTLLREHAVEHPMSSNGQCEVKACPAEAPEAPFVPFSPSCPHAKTLLLFHQR